MSRLINLPNSWVLTNIDKVCEFHAGSGFPTEMQGVAGQALPFYKVKDVSIAWLAHSSILLGTENSISYKDAELIKAKPVPEGCIVFAKIGEALRLNRRAIASQPSLIDNNLMGISAPTTRLATRYLYWFSVATRFDVDARSSVVPSIRKSDVGNLSIPLPPLQEQTRIVAKLEELLSDLDAGVAELKAAQKKLAQYRQSLLKAAVSGTLTAAWRAAQQPTTETGAQLLERILQQRRARWEAKQLAKFQEQGKNPPKDWEKKYPEPVQPDTAGLPALPPGWVWASGEQLCEFITKGTTPPKESASSVQKTIPFLRVTNLTDRGELDLADKVFISAEIHRGFLARSVVYPNDVLMNIVGPPLGQVAVVPSKFSEWNINQAIAIFRAVDGVFPWFICHYLLSPLAQQWLKARSKTTAGQTNLTLEVCRSLPFPLPPQDEQEALLLHIDMALSSIVNQQQSIALALQQSTAQCQNILRAAFSGQLVPQDPNDEPASVLLERIRAERAAQTAVKKPRGRKAQTAKEACDEN